MKQEKERKKRAIIREPMKRRWGEMGINNMEGRQKLEGEGEREQRENQSSGGFRLFLRHTSHTTAIQHSKYLGISPSLHYPSIEYLTFLVRLGNSMAL